MKNSRKFVWFWFGMWGAVIPLAIIGAIPATVAVLTPLVPLVVAIIAAALIGHIGKH